MSRRILVVDDDHAMVRTLVDILNLSGWDAVGVHSGMEAVEATKGSEYPFVLMDIRMPGMSGVDAFKAIKQASPSINVVLMTAHTAPEVIAEAERAGALRVINKPIDMPALMELLG